jgi:glutaminyl-tRNA synthetase
LYDWFLDALDIYHPQQIEFARLNMTYTMMSKRKLKALVDEGHVNDWDDPRMPTLSAMRRRGFSPASIRTFAEKVGVAKRASVVDYALLEHCVRDDLNLTAPRVMAVLKPLKVTIENYPEGQVEEFDAINNPEDENDGTRKVPFGRELYIEQTDFAEDPPPKFFRLAPGKEVRLKHAYFIRCKAVVKNDAGEIIELRCTYDSETRGGSAPDGRKVKGTLHWVSAAHAIAAEVRIYNQLFTTEDPEEGDDFRANLNPNSLEVLSDCKVEPSLREIAPGARFQFLRQGYFCVDPDSTADKLVFNRTASLRDSWAKIAKKQP